MNIELLQQLCEASAVSGDEQEVRDILINTLEPCVNEITFDGLTGERMTWSADGEPAKAPKAMKIVDGAYTAM